MNLILENSVSAKFCSFTTIFQGVERSIWEWVIFIAKFLTMEDTLRYFFAVFAKKKLTPFV